MQFRDLAWGAFIFAGVGREAYYGDPYQSLVGDVEFLERLRTEPSAHDFQRLRDFLVHYGLPWAPTNLSEQYADVWSRLKPHIERVASEKLLTCNFADSGIQKDIRSAYGYLQWPYVWGQDTPASKVLHFFNVCLFVMWDSSIETFYRKSGCQDYVEFLARMQKEAIEAIKDYQRLSLPGKVEEYLSHRLGYRTVRPLTKFLDDRNWIVITRGWPASPPDWLLNLYSQGKDGHYEELIGEDAE